MTRTSQRMRLSWFRLPKAGADWAEYEDAIGINRAALRFAVADGATESFASAAWARLLALNWVAEPEGISPERFQVMVGRLGADLHEEWTRTELAWYAEEKAKRGSHAAFAGLQLAEFGDLLMWTAIALGDACLMVRNGGKLSESFPLSSPEQFGTRPIMVPSLASNQPDAFSHLAIKMGTARPGDIFLLMTDAAAAWYLVQSEMAGSVLAEFDSLLANRRHEALTRLLEAERTARRLRNDDIAILRIAFDEADSM
jgi:hypothetical protein